MLDINAWVFDGNTCLVCLKSGVIIGKNKIKFALVKGVEDLNSQFVCLRRQEKICLIGRFVNFAGV